VTRLVGSRAGVAVIRALFKGKHTEGLHRFSTVLKMGSSAGVCMAVLPSHRTVDPLVLSHRFHSRLGLYDHFQCANQLSYCSVAVAGSSGKLETSTKSMGFLSAGSDQAVSHLDCFKERVPVAIINEIEMRDVERLPEFREFALRKR
jgi:hypothetical protein